MQHHLAAQGSQINHPTPALLNGISMVRGRAAPGPGARQDVWPEMSRTDDAFGDPRAGSSPRHPLSRHQGKTPSLPGVAASPAAAAPPYGGRGTPSISRAVRGCRELGGGSGWPLPAEGTVACLSRSARREPVPWDSSGGDIPALLALVRTEQGPSRGKNHRLPGENAGKSLPERRFPAPFVRRNLLEFEILHLCPSPR